MRRQVYLMEFLNPRVFMILFIVTFSDSLKSKFVLVHLVPQQNELNTNNDVLYDPSERLKQDADDDILRQEDDEQDYQGYDAYFGK